MTESSPSAPAPDKPEAPQLSQAEIDAIHLKIQKQKSHSNGSGWFYWIAGLSLITSVVSLSGGSWSFLAGLGVTQVLDAVAVAAAKAGTGSWIKIFSFVLDLIAASFFAVMGFYARKGKKPFYIIGMVFYGIDTLILLAFTEWAGVAFHAFALYQIWSGFSALRWFESLPAAQPVAEEPVVKASEEGAEPA